MENSPENIRGYTDIFYSVLLTFGVAKNSFLLISTINSVTLMLSPSIVHLSACLFVCPSVKLVDGDHIVQQKVEIGT